MMHFSDNELLIMRNSREMSTGGINLFWQFWSAPVDGTQEQGRMDLVGKSPDLYDPPLLEGQFVPLEPLPFISRLAHGTELQTIIIAGVGSGKTFNIALLATYYCCMIPNFRYLGTAPRSWQAEQAYRDLLMYAFDRGNEGGRPRRISRWLRNVKQRPYPMIEFVNGSTMEFKSVDKDASGIMTWGGDMASVDQAEDQSIDLEKIMMNLGTRLRGQVDGRARLGKLILLANSAYNPLLWEIYDDFDADPEQFAMTMTSYDNPYLTAAQLRSFEKMFRDKDEADRLMRSTRPLPKGKEFTQELIVACQSDSLDALMDEAIEKKMLGYIKEGSSNAGVVRWALPYQKGHMYILAGDPGQANPPYRNSPPILVFDITEFPQKPATLAAFYWVSGFGSYWPFINMMNYLYETYHPIEAAFDATGIQKAFDELGVLDASKLWLPLDLHGLKMHMVLCLKVLMGKGMVKMPKSLYSIWNQLLMWHMPDKVLRQDIASTLFMIGFLLNQFLPRGIASDEDVDFETRIEETDRWGRVRAVRDRVSLRSIP